MPRKAEPPLTEQAIQEQFTVDRFVSIAGENRESERLASLLVPDSQRGQMPFTQDKYLVRESIDLVRWEREVRKFLRYLSPSHGHRVSAVMIYEWATQVNLAKLIEQGGNANKDLRILNKILFFYFGKPYQTWIAGRKVRRAYRVKPGTYIKRRRPMTMELYAEWLNKTLEF